MHQTLLELRRKTHRETVDVDFLDVEALGLQKQLMSLAMRKPHHLVFERRAVARPDSGDLAVEQRRLVNVSPYELVDFVRRVQQRGTRSG